MVHDNDNGGLSTPVRFVKGVGEARAEQLARLNILTVGDLLLTLPRRYEDRRFFVRLSALRSGETSTVKAPIAACAWVRPRYGKAYFEAALSDGSGVARCRWFNAPYLQDQLKVGDHLIVYGKVSSFKGQTVFIHPEFEQLKGDEDESMHVGRIVPVYPLTEHLFQRTMRRILWNAVERFADRAEEILPEEVRSRLKLPAIRDALRQAHFPETLEQADRARYRLVFDEFICVQLVLVARKIHAERFLEGTVHESGRRLRGRFLESLPFKLTAAQQRMLDEIEADMRKPRPMHRLLQGDVGSGKTVVAICAIMDAVECGSQCAVMAPTEILAAQHARTFARYLEPLGIRVVLLTSNLKNAERRKALAGIQNGDTHVVVGTHAVIQEGVEFRKLGFIVIDEQHKFGVEQRGTLYGKGANPDVLVMTATPIPRTLAMTLYGDLDVSVLDEMPGGRQQIVTRVIDESKLPKAYGFIQQQVAKGRQAYLVYPLVSEQEKTEPAEELFRVELRSAEEMFQKLKKEVFVHERLGLLHGQMPVDEKNDVMERFRDGKIDILISTTVVEVGVDVPNATVMLVENAERFGLAQLHQLRGRIGRGAFKSFCILQGTPKTEDSWRRLKIMEETTDGFRIAEEDLKIRGMGNLLGREQSGLPAFRVGNLITDTGIMKAARQESFNIVESDLKLEDPRYAKLRARARELYKLVGPFVKVG